MFESISKLTHFFLLPIVYFSKYQKKNLNKTAVGRHPGTNSCPLLSPVRASVSHGGGATALVLAAWRAVGGVSEGMDVIAHKLKHRQWWGQGKGQQDRWGERARKVPKTPLRQSSQEDRIHL